jgi:golgi phosphoprotein 3
MSEAVAAVLDMAGIRSIIPVFATTEAACAQFKQGKKQASVLQPLNYAEELYLLALNEQDGTVKQVPAFALGYALAGALLMDLALCNRIDSDLATLKVVASEQTGDPLLDETLAALRDAPAVQPASFWLKNLAAESGRIEQRVLESLMAKGVLRQENRRVLWVFDVHRYPLTDDREVKEVRSRLRELIASEDIPAPRDQALVCLANACRLLDDLFSKHDLERLTPRIEALSGLDLIGHEMVEAIREIERDAAIMSMPFV